MCDCSISIGVENIQSSMISERGKFVFPKRQLKQAFPHIQEAKFDIKVTKNFDRLCFPISKKQASSSSTCGRKSIKRGGKRRRIRELRKEDGVLKFHGLRFYFLFPNPSRISA